MNKEMDDHDHPHDHDCPNDHDRRRFRRFKEWLLEIKNLIMVVTPLILATATLIAACQGGGPT